LPSAPQTAMTDLDEKQMGNGEKTAQPLFEEKRGNIVSVVEGEEVNASGHPDQLQRQYSIWSICGLALTIDNAWVVLGGSIVVAIGMSEIHPLLVTVSYYATANGGPPGILYEYLVACAYYALIAACIADVCHT
jgi:choline transport protein